MNKSLVVTALAFSGVLGGCSFLKAPDPEPVPAKPKPPPIDLFAPEDNVTPGAKLPGTYSLVGVDASTDPDSNEVVIVRSNTTTKDKSGNDVVVPSPVTEKMRLAGIILPPKGAPGRDSAVHAIDGWTFGKTDLEIEGDPQYPTDLQGRRLVQVYFKGTGGEWKDKRLNLNRMLVRSGYAVVDLHQASSIHPEKWFNDEQYARLRKDPTDPAHQRPAPLGLWKMGIILGQRPPVPAAQKATPTPASVGKGGATAPIGAAPAGAGPAGGAAKGAASAPAGVPTPAKP